MVKLELSPQNEKFIETAVASGGYRDRAHVLEEALDLLRKRDELRRDVNAGIE